MAVETASRRPYPKRTLFPQGMRRDTPGMRGAQTPRPLARTARDRKRDGTGERAGGVRRRAVLHCQAGASGVLL